MNRPRDVTGAIGLAAARLFGLDPAGRLRSGGGELRLRVIGLYVPLVAANVAAWIWAGLLFHGQPALLGMALLAYGLGLRHAVDADHIAAIDNVVGKLMQGGARPIGVGFFVVAWVVSVGVHRLGGWRRA